MPSILCFDTETSGLADFKASPQASHQPHCLEVGWLYSPSGQRHDVLPFNVLLNWGDIPFNPQALEVNGLKPEDWKQHGLSPQLVVNAFGQAVLRSELLVGHNVEFDILIMLCAAYKLGAEKGRALEQVLQGRPTYCTKQHSTTILKLPNDKSWGGPYKWPRLGEAYQFFYGKEHQGHRAMRDVQATWEVYHAIQSWIANQPGTEPPPAPTDNPYTAGATALNAGGDSAN